MTIEQQRIYPCDDCGKLRSKSEGGEVFTVCDECWDRHSPASMAAMARTLAHNLATAAALERAWLLGHSRGLFRPSKTDDDEIKAAYERDVWAPGRGKTAP